jgi:hypothetical protein
VAKRSDPRRGAALRAAFDQGLVPRVACFTKAKTPLGVDLGRLCRALQKFVDDHFAPVWGVSCRIERTTGFVKGAWALVFLDDSDAPGTLAYHDLTPEGLPLSKVFVRTVVKQRESVSVTASHELAEMLVDPAMNLLSIGPDEKSAWCYETADPVEEATFDVAGLPMSDFVHPAWFEGFRKPGSVRFDHLGRVKRPFQLLKGGYQIVLKNGKWSNQYGSKAKARAFAKEDRRGHRSEIRKSGRPRRSTASYGRVVADA